MRRYAAVFSEPVLGFDPAAHVNVSGSGGDVNVTRVVVATSPFACDPNHNGTTTAVLWLSVNVGDVRVAVNANGVRDSFGNALVVNASSGVLVKRPPSAAEKAAAAATTIAVGAAVAASVASSVGASAAAGAAGGAAGGMAGGAAGEPRGAPRVGLEEEAPGEAAPVGPPLCPATPSSPCLGTCKPSPSPRSSP